MPILNHLFDSLSSFVHLQEMRLTQVIVNAYQLKVQLFTLVVTTFISGYIHGKEHLNPQFDVVVNA